jgi:thioredoxin reductase (NADPH)
MDESVLKTDIAVVGAGPVGLFFVFEAGMLAMACHVIDALDAPGGQCTALYPEKPIYDIPGYPKILAGELIEKLRQQAAPFKPVYHLGQQVTGLDRTGDGRWQLATSTGARIEAQAVVIAAGVGAFGPHRPPLAGLQRYERLPPGQGVKYFVQRREDYRGKRVVIAGGGDSAVDWALSLADVAESLAVVHRRDKFRAAPESVRRLRELAGIGRIELVVPYQLAGLDGDATGLTAVIVSTLDGAERHLPADVLLPFYGLSQELGPIAGWGLDLHHNHVAVDPASGAAGLPGVFAIGDIATYPGKLKLILTGFAEAASAAHAIYPLVHPDRALHFQYSTTQGVPAAL